MQQKIAITLVGCCLIAGFPSMAGAQTVASSFAELAGTLKPGKTVYVTDGAGRKVKGTMTDLSFSSLEMLIDGKAETFAEARVRQMAERRRYTGTFAAGGLAVGAGLGVAFGLIVGPRCSCGGEALGIGLGLLAGLTPAPAPRSARPAATNGSSIGALSRGPRPRSVCLRWCQNTGPAWRLRAVLRNVGDC